MAASRPGPPLRISSPSGEPQPAGSRKTTLAVDLVATSGLPGAALATKTTTAVDLVAMAARWCIECDEIPQPAAGALCWAPRGSHFAAPAHTTQSLEDRMSTTLGTSGAPETRVFAHAAEGGDARWWLGGLALIKATSQQTGGHYTLVEVHEPEGADTPLHVHHQEDEAFWILEGEFTFEVGDAVTRVGPGSFLFGPRGVPHRYRVERGPARLLFMLSPGGFEQFIYETSEPAGALTLPPAADAPPSEAEVSALMEAAQRAGAEILG